MGNRRKPAAVKKAMGNPGRRPIPETNLPETGSAIKPSSVTGRASELWDQFAPALEILGTLKAESTYLFAGWCWLVAAFEADPSEFSASRIAQLRGLCTSLGMDPSAQSKFATAKPDSKEPGDEFFTGPQAVES